MNINNEQQYAVMKVKLSSNIYDCFAVSTNMKQVHNTNKR